MVGARGRRGAGRDARSAARDARQRRRVAPAARPHGRGARRGAPRGRGTARGTRGARNERSPAHGAGIGPDGRAAGRPRARAGPSHRSAGEPGGGLGAGVRRCRGGVDRRDAGRPAGGGHPAGARSRSWAGTRRTRFHGLDRAAAGGPRVVGGRGHPRRRRAASGRSARVRLAGGAPGPSHRVERGGAVRGGGAGRARAGPARATWRRRGDRGSAGERGRGRRGGAARRCHAHWAVEPRPGGPRSPVAARCGGNSGAGHGVGVAGDKWNPGDPAISSRAKRGRGTGDGAGQHGPGDREWRPVARAGRRRPARRQPVGHGVDGAARGTRLRAVRGRAREPSGAGGGARIGGGGRARRRVPHAGRRYGWRDRVRPRPA